MDSLTQFISFWGGIASIVALIITIVGGFWVMLKKFKERYKKELELLNDFRLAIAERAKAATTQGKRMDLYIYHQSILSAQRYSELIEEVRLSTIHIASFIFILFFASLDANANYYLDIAFGKGDLLYNNFGLIHILLNILLFYINISLRIQSNKNKRILNTLSNSLIDELDILINDQT